MENASCIIWGVEATQARFRQETLAARFPRPTRRIIQLSGKAVKSGPIHVCCNAGVPVEAGTDSLAGFALHRELELDTQAEIPSAEVLRLARLGAARIMKHDDELGSIAAGKLADIVLVDGNPVANISDVRKPVVVVKNGVVYRPSELDAELEFSRKAQSLAFQCELSSLLR